MAIEDLNLLFQVTSEGLLVFLVHCIVLIGIFVLRSRLSQVSCKVKVSCAPNVFSWSANSEQQSKICKEKKLTSEICLEEITPEETNISLSIIQENFNCSLIRSPSLEKLLKDCFKNEDKERRISPEVFIEPSQIISPQTQSGLQLVQTPISIDDQFKLLSNPASRKTEYISTEVEHTTLKGFIEECDRLQNIYWSLDDVHDITSSSCSKLDTDITVLKCSKAISPSLFTIEENQNDIIILPEDQEEINTKKSRHQSQYSETKNGRNVYGKLHFSGCICELLGYSYCMTENNQSSKICVSKEILERKIHCENNSGSQISSLDDDVPSTSSSVTENETFISNSNEDYSLLSSGQSSNRSYERRFDSGSDSSFIYESDSQTVIILQIKEGVSLIHSRKTTNGNSISNNPHKENQIKFLPQIRLLLEKATSFRRFSHCLETHKKYKISLPNLLRTKRRHSSPVIPAIKNNQYDALETLLTKMRTSGKFRLL